MDRINLKGTVWGRKQAKAALRRSGGEIDGVVTLTPAQCRAARAMLGWTNLDLARRSDLSASTVSFFETGRAFPQVDTRDRLQLALQAGGVTFIRNGVIYDDA